MESDCKAVTVLENICNACKFNKLHQRAAQLPPHSDKNAKQQQRNLIIDHIQKLLIQSPQSPIAMLIFDDFLDGNLFIDDLKNAIPDINLSLVFSPNVKTAVVQQLRKAGIQHTAELCACKFLEQYQHTIREAGGFSIVFADVYGGFDHGAKLVLEDLTRQKLYATRPGVIGLLAFAASDLGARFQGESRLLESRKVGVKVHDMFLRQCDIIASQLLFLDDFPTIYRSMQFYAWHLQWRYG